MELLFELLLTAAATLLVAFLLASLFSSAAAANADTQHDRAVGVGPADVIAEEKAEEEERTIEVDEATADAAAPTLAEGWVEVEKPPAAAVAEGTAKAWLAEEERVPAALAPELFLGTVLKERKEEGEVGKKPRDLAAPASATEAAGKDFGVEAAPREILGLGLEKETARQHDSDAEVAPTEVPAAELQNQQVQPTEAVVVDQRHLVAEAAPAEVIEAGPDEEEGTQAAQVIQHDLASEAVPDVALEKQEQQQEEQVVEVARHELAAEVAPREIPDEVPRVLAAEVAPREIPDEVPREEEELKERSVEEVVGQHEQVQNKEEAQCELGAVDQQEKLLLPQEELLVATKADDLNVSQEGSSDDKVAAQLPEKQATTLLGMPVDEAGGNTEFEEWQGIERSEVEKRFGAAAAFAASDAGVAALSKLDNDVQLQLQGLLKVAIDGPCYDSTQPLTLRPSSRAKWVSWQKLGNMHPEIAMEKYMDLLSEFIPGWIGDKIFITKKHEDDVESETMTARTSDPQTNQGNEGSTSIDEGPLTSLPDPEKGQSSDILAE